MQFQSFLQFLTDVGQMHAKLLIFGAIIFGSLRSALYVYNNFQEIRLFLYSLVRNIIIGLLILYFSAPIGAFIGGLLNLNPPYWEVMVSICAIIAGFLGLRFWRIFR